MPHLGLANGALASALGDGLSVDHWPTQAGLFSTQEAADAFFAPAISIIQLPSEGESFESLSTDSWHPAGQGDDRTDRRDADQPEFGDPLVGADDFFGSPFDDTGEKDGSRPSIGGMEQENRADSGGGGGPGPAAAASGESASAGSSGGGAERAAPPLVSDQLSFFAGASGASIGAEPPLGMHIHPHLTIVINGQEQVIPANIGIGPEGGHPLDTVHTHDTSGILHVESPKVRDFRLQEFFKVWGQTFTSQEILGHHADATHALTMTVNGRPSEALGSLVLHDGDDIVIRLGDRSGDLGSGIAPDTTLSTPTNRPGTT